jgi:hypothetical protein
VLQRLDRAAVLQSDAGGDRSFACDNIGVAAGLVVLEKNFSRPAVTEA